MIISREEGVEFTPVTLYIDCNGETKIYDFNHEFECFEANKEGHIDFGFFKLPENRFVEIDVATVQRIYTGDFELGHLKNLANQVKNSKLSIQKIFGFPENSNSDKADVTVSLSKVKQNLENMEIDVSDYILNAFVLKNDKKKISLRILKNKLENWANNLDLLEGIKAPVSMGENSSFADIDEEPVY